MSARRRWQSLVVVALVVGCAPDYDGVSVRKRYGEADAQASRTGISLRHGDVMVFELRPQAEGDPITEVAMDVWIESSDYDIAVVRPSILTNAWAVNGVHVGTTEMLVEVDGELRESIPVEVEPEVTP
ncbi:MAG: hypothetical protein H6712_19635 [Myxococcales bacterium]|nr:hypothetical protein [Myxococcales bacterium]MCB9716089.1 hypothetical protein [Myxococcales bacterium]